MRNEIPLNGAASHQKKKLCQTLITDAARRIVAIFDKLNRLIKTHLPARRGTPPYKRLNPYRTFAEVAITVNIPMPNGAKEALRKRNYGVRLFQQ